MNTVGNEKDRNGDLSKFAKNSFMMGPLLLSTESKGGKRIYGDEAVFSVYIFLSPRYRSREIPQGARREYEWQDVATNMHDS